MTEVFVIGCPLPKKGCSYDTTAIKSTNRNLGNPEMIRGKPADIAKLRRELEPCARRHGSEWTHSTSGCISPVEFRKTEAAGKASCACNSKRQCGGVGRLNRNDGPRLLTLEAVGIQQEVEQSHGYDAVLVAAHVDHVLHYDDLLERVVDAQ